MRHPETHKGARPLPPLGLKEQEEAVIYPESKKCELGSEMVFEEGQRGRATQGIKAGRRKEEISLHPSLPLFSLLQ